MQWNVMSGRPPLAPMLLSLQEFHTLLAVIKAHHKHAQNIAVCWLKMKVAIWKGNYRCARSTVALVLVISIPNGHLHVETVPSDVLGMLMLSLMDSQSCMELLQLEQQWTIGGFPRGLRALRGSARGSKWRFWHFYEKSWNYENAVFLTVWANVQYY